MGKIQITCKEINRKMGEDKMSIKIDMDMPKNCLECKFCAWLELDTEHLCQLTQRPLVDVVTNIYKDKRHPLCPLKEVKE